MAVPAIGALQAQEAIVRISIEPSSSQFFVRFKGNNGEIIASTELYTTKASAQNVIRVIQAEAASAPVTDNS